MFSSLHALLEHRVPSGLADDDVRPLHHHDAHKERRVTRELHDLTLLVGLSRRETDENFISDRSNKAALQARAGRQ